MSGFVCNMWLSDSTHRISSAIDDQERIMDSMLRPILTTDVDPKFLFGLLFPDPHSKATVGEVKCDDGGSFFSL